MMRSCRIFGSMLWLGLIVSVSGCQARQMVNHYLSFDALVTDLYEKHVLYNLARRDNGRTMVQMDYRSFSASLNTNFGTSGKVQFFTNPQNEVSDGTSISLNMFRQAFEPNVNSSTGTGLNIASAPADHQDAIRVLYDEQVSRPEDMRVFQRTSSRLVAMRSYCWVRTNHGEIYYVPHGKHREFADFVHKVSFYKPAPPPASTPPSAQPGTQPARPPTATLRADEYPGLDAPAAVATQPATTQPANASSPVSQPLPD